MEEILAFLLIVLLYGILYFLIFRDPKNLADYSREFRFDLDDTRKDQNEPKNDYENKNV